MNQISRRRFLEDSLALLAVTALPVPALAAAGRRRRRVGPNDRIRAAVIGVGGRGGNHVDEFLRRADVNLVAICDADTAHLADTLRAVGKAGRPAPRTYEDVRALLDSKDIDVVSIATPNHWHALGAIWAMQAGKDVYVEKPVSHNVVEGRRAVEVARRLGRICQAGTQSRSSRGLQEAMAYLHGGELGKVTLARALCYKPRGSIGKVAGPQPVPSTVDYNQWLGPAPQKPPTRQRFHYDWHWFWDYGNGDLGNQGVHEMDKARWGLGVHTFPKSVIALGGRFGYDDDGETPNTELAFFDYRDSQLIFEVRGLRTDALKGAKIGNLYYAEKGLMVVPDYGSATVYDNDGNKVREFRAGGDHFGNFLDAVRSRSTSDLNADIEEGHQSAALCHLANISYRLGKRQPFSKKTKAFGDNKEAYETFGRFEEHLAANGVTLAEASYTVGPKLAIDPSREAFAGSRAANALLTREYRKPFVVPANG